MFLLTRLLELIKIRWIVSLKMLNRTCCFVNFSWVLKTHKPMLATNGNLCQYQVQLSLLYHIVLKSLEWKAHFMCK
jgi:hypothetical protein